MSTPAKTSHHRRLLRSPNHHHSDQFENIHPNSRSSTNPHTKTPSKTLAASATKSKKVCNPKSPPPPPAAVLPCERKFIVPKKSSRTATAAGGESKKGLEAAYEALQLSQEDFFSECLDDGFSDVVILPPKTEKVEVSIAFQELKHKKKVNEIVLQELENKNDTTEIGSPELEECSAGTTKTKSSDVEEVMNCLPEPGSGRVKHLVKAFEGLILRPSKEAEVHRAADNSVSKMMNWALHGLQPCMPAVNGSSVLLLSSAEFEFPKDLKRDPRLYSSLDSHGERLSWGSSTTSKGGRRSRRNSTDSSGRSWTKKLKVTSQKPFKLRTEQRGRLKKEHFIQKVQEMFVEEEKKRIRIAQNLPWTTDEPECIPRLPVKNPTEPLDIILHSDVRAIERSEFDHYVSERNNVAEQLKMERERLRKLEEEDEIRQLRRELVPKAQPMPYFDRPFVPKKSSKSVRKEPRIHLKQHKS